MKFTVTLNTKTHEYNDIEVECGMGDEARVIVKQAAWQAGISLSEVTSFVIVGSNPA